MSDKQRKMRLAWFVLLSACAFTIAVSCQSQRQQVAIFDETPAVVAERQTGDIGQRMRSDGRTDKTSPIYGMPILDVDKAENVIVLKRSMKSGFAGIDNPLYENPKTAMLFGDAKKSIDAVNNALKQL